jgi:SPW repeat
MRLLRRRETILDIYTLVLGAVLFVSPWLFSYAHEAARADDWTSSLLVIASSAATLIAFAEWEEWANLIVGLWVLASPWLLGFAHGKAMPVNVALGLLIAFMSALELWLIHYDPAPRTDRQDTGTAVT